MRGKNSECSLGLSSYSSTTSCPPVTKPEDPLHSITFGLTRTTPTSTVTPTHQPDVVVVAEEQHHHPQQLFVRPKECRMSLHEFRQRLRRQQQRQQQSSHVKDDQNSRRYNGDRTVNVDVDVDVNQRPYVILDNHRTPGRTKDADDDGMDRQVARNGAVAT